MSPFYSFDLNTMSKMGSLMCQPITFIWVDYTSIISVSSQENNLVKVSLEFFNLPNVQTTNLSYNELHYLPSEGSETTDGLRKCCRLLFLSLSHNKLTDLPLCLCLLPSLQTLNAGDNNLKYLTKSKDPLVSKDIGFWPSLTEINLSHNKLKRLHDFLFCLPKVTKLNLSNNLLISLPSTTRQYESIQELDVNNNQLTILPCCEGDKFSETRSVVLMFLWWQAH